MITKGERGAGVSERGAGVSERGVWGGLGGVLISGLRRT